MVDPDRRAASSSLAAEVREAALVRLRAKRSDLAPADREDTAHETVHAVNAAVARGEPIRSGRMGQHRDPSQGARSDRAAGPEPARAGGGPATVRCRPAGRRDWCSDQLTGHPARAGCPATHGARRRGPAADVAPRGSGYDDPRVGGRDPEREDGQCREAHPASSGPIPGSGRRSRLGRRTEGAATGVVMPARPDEGVRDDH